MLTAGTAAIHFARGKLKSEEPPSRGREEYAQTSLSFGLTLTVLPPNAGEATLWHHPPNKQAWAATRTRWFARAFALMMPRRARGRKPWAYSFMAWLSLLH